MGWSLRGNYIESCNCETACPCVFLSPPTEGECTVLIAWHIDEGKDGDVSLDGLNVALAVHAPGHMAQVKWNAAVYVDAKASAAQEQALLKIFGGQAGGHPAALGSFIGKIVGVKKVPFEFSQRGKSFALSLGGVAEASGEALEGAGGAPVEISGHPLGVAPGFPATVGRSTRLTYNDHGMRWDLSGKNAFFSPFAYQG